MSVSSRELRAERANLHNRMTELVDRAEAEKRNLSAEEKGEFERIHNEQNDLLERIGRLEELEGTRAELDGPAAPPVGPGRSAVITGVDPGDDVAARHAAHRAAMLNYLRLGPNDMSYEDKVTLGAYKSALQTVSGAGGGFLVPPAFRAGVIEAMKAYGGMRTSGAEIINTSEGQDLPFATNDDTGNVGEILAEGGTASEQDTSFGVRILKAFVYSSKVVRVSNQLLNDSAFNLEAYLTRVFATRIGRITNTHFTAGTASNQPAGVLNDSVLGTTTANATTFTYDEVLALEHSVDPAYRAMPTAGFMFNDNTLLKFKQLKDGEGRPLWMPSTRDGEPDRIDGYRYTVNQDMSSVATAVKSILFGDFVNYKIRDVEGMAVRRLEELYALQNQVAFLAFSRHDGGLVDAGQGSIKHLLQA